MLGGKRLDRVNELVRKELSDLLKREVEFEQGTLVTVTRVSASQDLEHAKVWVSVLPVEQAASVLTKLNECIRELQHLLNKKLVMESVPKIRFLLDESEGRASKIEALLDSLGDSQ